MIKKNFDEILIKPIIEHDEFSNTYKIYHYRIFRTYDDEYVFFNDKFILGIVYEYNGYDTYPTSIIYLNEVPDYHKKYFQITI